MSARRRKGLALTIVRTAVFSLMYCPRGDQPLRDGAIEGRAQRGVGEALLGEAHIGAQALYGGELGAQFIARRLQGGFAGAEGLLQFRESFARDIA